MAAGIAVFCAVVFGAVTAGADSSDGSNTRNGVMVGPELPGGLEVDRNRLHAPDYDAEGGE
jgi:hypothetical protein